MYRKKQRINLRNWILLGESDSNEVVNRQYEYLSKKDSFEHQRNPVHRQGNGIIRSYYPRLNTHENVDLIYLGQPQKDRYLDRYLRIRRISERILQQYKCYYQSNAMKSCSVCSTLLELTGRVLIGCRFGADVTNATVMSTDPPPVR